MISRFKSWTQIIWEMYLPLILSITYHFWLMDFGILHGYTVWYFAALFPFARNSLFAPSRRRDLRRDLSRDLRRDLPRDLRRDLDSGSVGPHSESSGPLNCRFWGVCDAAPSSFSFEKPSTICRRRLAAEIGFSNSFRGLWKCVLIEGLLSWLCDKRNLLSTLYKDVAAWHLHSWAHWQNVY